MFLGKGGVAADGLLMVVSEYVTSVLSKLFLNMTFNASASSFL